MDNTEKTVLVLVILCALVAGFSVVSGIIRETNNNANPCVIAHPLEGNFGNIDYVGGLFSTPIPRYWVNATGKLKLTGEICEEAVYVTEREYERIIYGHK